MTPSKALCYFCISFAVGIFCESFLTIPGIFLWGFLFAGVACIATGFFVKKPAAVAGFCLIFLVLGVARLQISEFAMASDRLSQLNGAPEKITLTGIIVAEPAVKTSSQKLKVKIDDVKSVVLVTTHRYPEYKYLDAIQMTGKLKTPAAFLDFDYKNYLAKDGIYSVMDFPAIEILSSPHPVRGTASNGVSFAYEKIVGVKKTLVKSLNAIFLPPQSNILEGVVFGNDANMPRELKDKFNATGLSHITAVSGTNIVILITMLMVSLLALGFWRGRAFWAAIVLIWLYIIMIGFPVSGIRAAIMGCMGLAAGNLGRQNTSGRVLTMAGAVMLMQNPMLLTHDISFQLSFMASLGIIHIKPLIDYYLTFIPKEHFPRWAGFLGRAQHGKYWLDIVSVTLAAQVITLPIIVYNFGTVSLISPITNFLVVPIIPLLTVFGFFVSVAGVFSAWLGFIFSLPCQAILFYVLKMLDLFSGPWATKTLEHISFLWVAGYYGILAVLIKFLKNQQRPTFLG